MTINSLQAINIGHAEIQSLFLPTKGILFKPIIPEFGLQCYGWVGRPVFICCSFLYFLLVYSASAGRLKSRFMTFQWSSRAWLIWFHKSTWHKAAKNVERLFSVIKLMLIKEARYLAAQVIKKLLSCPHYSSLAYHATQRMRVIRHQCKLDITQLDS